MYAKTYTEYYRRVELFHQEANDRKAAKITEAVSVATEVETEAVVMSQAVLVPQLVAGSSLAVKPITSSTVDNTWSETSPLHPVRRRRRIFQ